MKWGRILVAGIGTYAAVLLVITLVVTGYAFKLAFEVQGAPDQTRIGQFAEYLSRSSWWVLQILLTVPAAAWAVRKIQFAPSCTGPWVTLKMPTSVQKPRTGSANKSSATDENWFTSTMNSPASTSTMVGAAVTPGRRRF